MVNPGSPLRRWLSRLGWLVGALAALALAGLMVANWLDYRRYSWAAHFERSASPEKIRELARACFALGKAGYSDPTTYPPIIAELKPRWVSTGSDDAQIGLYGHDEDRDRVVFLVFHEREGNLVVSVCDYFRGSYKGRPIYVQDQAAYDFLHPHGRIVTLGQWTMGDYGEWIVLPDELRIVVGPKVFRRPISAAEREAAEAAVRAIPPEVRGQRFDIKALDGIRLRILFAADGRPGTGDVELDNTWREEVGPLADLVARLSPKEAEFRFGPGEEREAMGLRDRWIERIPVEQPERTAPATPWWCLWPRLRL